MAACLGFVGDTPILIHAIKLLCTSQIIPKSRVVHLADKQILKRYILSYPKIIVSKDLPGGGEGGVGGLSIPGPWTFDTWPMCRWSLMSYSGSETRV